MKKLIIALALLSAMSPQPASAQIIPIPPPAIEKIIDLASAAYGVATTTLAGVLYIESGYNPNAIGDHGTSFGCAQIHAPAHPDISLDQMFDPWFSINYLAEQISKGNGWMWTGYRMLKVIPNQSTSNGLIDSEHVILFSAAGDFPELKVVQLDRA